MPATPLNLCFICNEYPPNPHGGIGTFVKTLAHQLSALSYEVSVVGYSAKAQKTGWISDGFVRVLQLATPKWWNKALPIGRYALSPAILLSRMYLSRAVQKVVRQLDIELVESYDWSGPLWSPPRNVPLVVRLHGANTASAYYEGRPASRLLHHVERRNVKFADALVAVSNHIGTVTLQSLQLEDRQFSVIYNGVDTRSFRPQDVDREPFEVLYVGSFHRRKGVHELVRAWPHVLAEVPQARLTFIGRIPDGNAGQEMIAKLLADLSALQRDTVSFVGYIPHQDLPAWYSRAAVAVFPSHAEAFGLTCAEAMACGAAVVMTSRGSGPEVVEDGVSGLLADPSDIHALASTVIRLLQNTPLRQTMGECARQRVRERFDSQALIAQNLVFYAEVIRGYHGIRTR